MENYILSSETDYCISNVQKKFFFGPIVDIFTVELEYVF